jgi:hypothetical protein
VAALDDDPQPELCANGSSWSAPGRVGCWDGLTGDLLWDFELPVPSNLVVETLAVGDVDADGELEVIAGTAGNYGGFLVFSLDGASGALEWTSPAIGAELDYATPRTLRIADVDADGGPPELVIGDSYGGRFAVLAGESGALLFLSPPVSLRALDTPDRDGDGKAELVIATESGALRRVSPTTGATIATIGAYSGTIDGLAIADLDGDGVADYAFGLDGRLMVRSGADGATLFASPLLGPGTGRSDSLHIVEADGDLAPEILVGTGIGLALYDTPGRSLLIDGFEDGTTSAWTPVPW